MSGGPRRTPQVTVLDYGMGNLRSVERALTAAGASVRVAATADEARDADRLVFPGQGAFEDAMRRVTETGLDDVLRAHWQAERPFLGICLGLQALFDESEEHGPVAGLGLLRGRVERFPDGLNDASGRRLKVPHMGWNRVEMASGHPVFAGMGGGGPEDWFYFVHSYFAVAEDDADVAVWATHGVRFCAGVARGPLVAVQFHPEKSQRAGLALLERFLAL